MDRSDSRREPAHPTLNRGPLRFVDNGEEKRQIRCIGRRFRLGTLLGRREENNSPAAMRKNEKADIHRKVSSGETVI